MTGVSDALNNPFGSEVRFELAGADLERLVVVGGDLEYLIELPNDRLLTHTEVRFAAGILRRLLLDGQLNAIWKPIGQATRTRPTVETSEIDTTISRIPNQWIHYALAAASSFATNLGVLVVIADEIHSASRVQKSHRTSGSAFRSPNGGPLGYVSEGCPRILNRPTFRPAFPARSDRASVEIGLVTVSLGDNGSALDALATNVDGLVIAGFGAGHVPFSYVERLERLALRIPVVLSSRIGAGTVLKDTYAFRGSESDLLARGLISAGYLDSFKARILLLVRHLVAAHCSLDGIRRYFEVAGGEGGHDSPSLADMGSI